MKLLLDTTILIDVLRKRHGRREFLADLEQRDHELAVSAINVGEVYGGLRPSEKVITDAFLSTLECLPVTQSIARQAGMIKSYYSRLGKTLALHDMIIAATAIDHELLLVTNNRKHFDLPELKLYPLP